MENKNNAFGTWDINNDTNKLRDKILKFRNSTNSRAAYSKELKKEIIDLVKDKKEQGIEIKHTLSALGICKDSYCRWKKEQDGIVNVRSVSHGKSQTRYSISTKIQIAEQVLTYGKSISDVANTMGYSWGTVSNWVKDYQDGLFTLENVTQVSRKKFKTYDVLLDEFKKLESDLESKKAEVLSALEKEYQDKLKEIKG